MRTPGDKYERRKHAYENLLQKQSKAIAAISNLRLLAFVAAVGFAVAAIAGVYPILFGTLAGISLILFIYLIIRHDKYIRRKQYTSLLIGINEASLCRLNGEWASFPDSGADFADDTHQYSQDLDIFGPGSLFQLINTAATHKGRHLLKDLLAGKPDPVEQIQIRQDAVNDLSARLGWRQRFQSEALTASGKMGDPEKLIQWSNELNKRYRQPLLVAVIRIAPVITLLLCILSFVLHIIPFYIPAAALIMQFAALALNKKKRHKTFAIADRYASDIKVYYKLLQRIEKQHFTSPYLMELSASMNNQKGLHPSKQLDRLSKIIDSMSNRFAPFYVIFNTLILWDYQNMIALEKWKEASGKYIEQWLVTAARFEALSSLSILRHDNPDWAVPSFSREEQSVFRTEELGHPLLGSKKVSNSLQFHDAEKALLITGSNMSGKSTLLRTAGINLVLAYAGAPVCARTFCASIMEIYTCMRISDNLGKSISSFYAELLRIKTIVREAKADKKIFFLLDEIFKGTNSKDRHTGARVLISKLSSTPAIGMVSTHDLELCSLEEENPRIKNYHFQEFFEDGKIYFDYLLRPGASTTSNAIYLMRMAGIDI